jgi:hypothetical protein
MARVTSGLWVAAHVRRCNLEGMPAVVMRRGAEEAGAILVVVDRLDGRNDLYAPAPQMMFDEARPSDRLFQKIRDGVDGLALSEAIASEVRFDPDVWVVAVEDREGRSLLDLA